MFYGGLMIWPAIYARKCTLISNCSCSSPPGSTAGTFLKVTYGYTVQEGTDPFVELSEKAMAVASLLATPGSFLVDVVPARKAKL